MKTTKNELIKLLEKICNEMDSRFDYVKPSLNEKYLIDLAKSIIQKAKK